MPSSTSAMWEALVCAELLQLCLTLSNPMDHNPPGSYVHGILQAGILGLVAIPGPKSLASCALASRSFTTVPPTKPVGLVSF